MVQDFVGLDLEFARHSGASYLGYSIQDTDRVEQYISQVRIYSGASYLVYTDRVEQYLSQVGIYTASKEFERDSVTRFSTSFL